MAKNYPKGYKGGMKKNTPAPKSPYNTHPVKVHPPKGVKVTGNPGMGKKSY